MLLPPVHAPSKPTREEQLLLCERSPSLTTEPTEAKADPAWRSLRPSNAKKTH